MKKYVFLLGLLLIGMLALYSKGNLAQLNMPEVFGGIGSSSSSAAQ